MIPFKSVGPDVRHERTSAQGHRDIRPFGARLSEALRSSASGVVLAGAGGATFFFPEIVDLSVPIGVLYAAWVLTRRVVLPFRLPRSAHRRDWNHPSPGTRKPRMAAGSHFIGTDQLTGQEIWISDEDLRQHQSLPGTTGSGKTTTITSLLSNTFCHGSGCVIVDGKGSNDVYGQVYSVARVFGRENDVRVLDLRVANGTNDSNTTNPFATGNADALRELMASQLGEQSPTDQNGLFRGRAVALLGSIAPPLVWMRDVMGIAIDVDRIRVALELQSIWMLAMKKRFRVRDPETGTVTEIPVPDIPENIIYPLQAYLGEIPGYDLTLPYNQQKTEKPSEQHGYAVFYFTLTFTQLAVSLGHIFKVQRGDVVMRDVVLNRRILVVLLPALENSDDTLAALGKLIVASLRAMMAQVLGAPLEGDAGEFFALRDGMGGAPFEIVFDEMAYYATSGMDRMLAMGRGLDMAFKLAFQEISGIWARLGEKTASLLGNANLTFAMRLQDAERTKRWIESTAGQSFVAQATSFSAGIDGNYREGHQAELRQVARVEWADLQQLVEGEAILLSGGKRIYARLFHVDLGRPMAPRINRPVQLAPPTAAEIEAGPGTLARVAEAVRTGALIRAPVTESTPELCALFGAFAAGRARGASLDEAAAAAVAAVAVVPVQPGATRHAEPPETEFTTALDLACRTKGEATEPPGYRAFAIDGTASAALAKADVLAGTPSTVAQANAAAVLAERNTALASVILPRVPPMTSAEFVSAIEGLVTQLDAVANRRGADEGGATARPGPSLQGSSEAHP